MMDETIRDAIGLRKAIASVGKRIKESDEKEKWFFCCYQPDRVVNPEKPDESCSQTDDQAARYLPLIQERALVRREEILTGGLLQ